MALFGLTVTGCKSVKTPNFLTVDLSGSEATPPTKSKPSETPLKNFMPEDFGAIGDGLTNDTAAFVRMTAAVNSTGGGTVILRPVTYIVGGHVSDPSLAYAFAPANIMEFDGCHQPLLILGNGARLRCPDGLRFGTFDPVTGDPTSHPLPYYGTGELASPYVAMISVKNCLAGVSINNVELDGNLANLKIGGQYGDAGWQIPAYGLRLINNVEKEQLVEVHTHHHPVDGLLIDGDPGRSASSLIQGVNSEYNGRQGCSIIGGANYFFEDCKFNHTGKDKLASAPGSGFDIEAESSPIRGLSFNRCEFQNNNGAGLVADSGDSADATFSNCLFVGTTNWAAWPKKPGFRFQACQFVGSICNTFGDSDPQRAAQFKDCLFLDNPTLSSTGEVYQKSFPIADVSDFANVLFDGCQFLLTNGGVLPWSINAIYKDVTMVQASSKQAYPRGTYLGKCRIDGNVDLYGSKILGQLTVNNLAIATTN